MNILITESQYNRVLLNEQAKERVFFKDSNLKVYDFYTDSNPNYEILLPFGPTEFETAMKEKGFFVQNLNQKSRMIFTISQKSPHISFPKMSVELKYGERKWVNYTIDKSKFGSFSASITFSYILPGLQPVTKNLSLAFKRINPELQACKEAFSDAKLKEATDWWKNWLNSKATQQRFANTFGYSLSYVQIIFFEYVKILDQIKLEYVFDKTLNNGAWVRPLWKSGYDIPININCPVAMKESSNEMVQTLIHEIQHVLSSYHKFEHPLQDNFFKDFFDFYKDLFVRALESDPDKEFEIDQNSEPYKKLYKLMQSTGFKDVEIVYVLWTYFWRLRYDEEHLKSVNEIRSSLAEVRRFLKLKPEQRITKEMLINNSRSEDVEMFLAQWLYSGKSLTEFLNYYNSLAMANPGSVDRNLA